MGMTLTIPNIELTREVLVWSGVVVWYLLAYIIVRLVSTCRTVSTSEQVFGWITSPVFFPVFVFMLALVYLVFLVEVVVKIILRFLFPPSCK
jgi:hypothetical protein